MPLSPFPRTSTIPSARLPRMPVRSLGSTYSASSTSPLLPLLPTDWTRPRIRSSPFMIWEEEPSIFRSSRFRRASSRSSPPTETLSSVVKISITPSSTTSPTSSRRSRESISTATPWPCSASVKPLRRPSASFRAPRRPTSICRT
ncbi:hypothetical protein L596_021415 [Steinernema carpocapsae]|uniref:Uncharacterized protein n=1 Tax=Steinernema carpocapsae TaxID=34508 RepID=A0A4U5MIR2_STECR|nr:hypothetical protein L596_021415 [Steinernema carpocapsae]